MFPSYKLLQLSSTYFSSGKEHPHHVIFLDLTLYDYLIQTHALSNTTVLVSMDIGVSGK